MYNTFMKWSLKEKERKATYKYQRKPRKSLPPLFSVAVWWEWYVSSCLSILQLKQIPSINMPFPVTTKPKNRKVFFLCFLL